MMMDPLLSSSHLTPRVRSRVKSGSWTALTATTEQPTPFEAPEDVLNKDMAQGSPSASLPFRP